MLSKKFRIFIWILLFTVIILAGRALKGEAISDYDDIQITVSITHEYGSITGAYTNVKVNRNQTINLADYVKPKSGYVVESYVPSQMVSLYDLNGFNGKIKYKKDTGSSNDSGNNLPAPSPGSFQPNPDYNGAAPAGTYQPGEAPAVNQPSPEQGEEAYIYVDYEEVGGRKIYAQSTIKGRHGEILNLRDYVTNQVTYKHVGFNPQSGYVTFDAKRRNTGKIIYEKDYKPAVDSQVYPTPNPSAVPVDQSGNPIDNSLLSGAKLTANKNIRLIGGYPDGSMRPRNPVTREEVAAIFYKLMDENFKQSISAEGFYDEQVKPANWSYDAISKMVSGNIMKNRYENQFKPKNNATREEVAKVVAAFIEDKTHQKIFFTDVLNNDQDIELVAVKGLMKGYPDGSFRPTAEITRAELVVVLNKLMERNVNVVHGEVYFSDVKKTDWFYQEIQASVQGN